MTEKPKMNSYKLKRHVTGDKWQ